MLKQGPASWSVVALPQVFTGKIVIPGDMINEYLALMRKAEEEREPFVKMLGGTLEGYEAYLREEKGFTQAPVRKHCMVVAMFHEFLPRQTDVWKYEEVTKGMANTHFRAWYKKKVWGGPDLEQVRVSLPKFFAFLREKKGAS